MNDTECYVKHLFESLCVTSPNQLSIHHIAAKLKVKVIYWEYPSALAERRGKFNVFINQELNEQQQWQDFGHEMKHYCFDRGSQIYLKDSFIGYKEIKADYFSYHFCIPTFMLDLFKEVSAYEIARIFNVEPSFALKRMDMYRNNAMLAAESRLVY